MTVRAKSNTTMWVKNAALGLMLLWIKADLSAMRSELDKVPIIEERQSASIIERDEMKKTIYGLVSSVQTLNIGVSGLQVGMKDINSVLETWGFKNAMK